MEEDDSVFVARCQLGNTEAFGVLYDRYLDKIYRFVYYKTFDKEVTEDLTSEVFHKALKKIGSFDGEKGNFSSWIYRIARNSVIDYYRTKKDEVSVDDVFDIGVDERTAEAIDAISDLNKVTAYLETLSSKQREIIVLRVWEEMSYKEIALAVGGSEDSVKMAFSRGIRELREKCGPISLSLIFLACGNVSTLLFKDLS